MTPRRSPAQLVRSRPVLAYYVLTFALSWSAVLWAMARDGIPPTKATLQEMLPAGIVSLLVGPSVAGLLLTAWLDGKAGLLELRSSAFQRRASVRWYALALLLAPLVLLAVHLGLSLFSPVYLPGVLTRSDRAAHVGFGLGAAVVTGICEETGWTGFATPRLRQRHGILATGLFMGVLWGIWHIVPMVILASRAYSAPLSPELFVTVRTLNFLVGSLVPYRVLMVWIHDRTRSLGLAMLMHAGLTAANIVYEPEAIGGTSLYLLDLVSGVAMWSLLAVVAATNRDSFFTRRSTDPA